MAWWEPRGNSWTWREHGQKLNTGSNCCESAMLPSVPMQIQIKVLWFSCMPYKPKVCGHLTWKNSGVEERSCAELWPWKTDCTPGPLSLKNESYHNSKGELHMERDVQKAHIHVMVMCSQTFDQIASNSLNNIYLFDKFSPVPSSVAWKLD